MITFTFAKVPTQRPVSQCPKSSVTVRKGCSMHPGNVVLRTLGERLPLNFNKCRTTGYGVDCKGVDPPTFPYRQMLYRDMCPASLSFPSNSLPHPFSLRATPNVRVSCTPLKHGRCSVTELGVAEVVGNEGQERHDASQKQGLTTRVSRFVLAWMMNSGEDWRLKAS